MKKYDIAITACVYDLLHQGHLELINLMRKNAQYLTMFLHDDFSTFQNKKKFPVQNYNHREQNLLNFVEEIIKVKNKSPEKEFTEFLRKNLDKKIIYIRGDDWREFPGKKTIEDFNIPIIYKKYTPEISSTILRNNLTKI